MSDFRKKMRNKNIFKAIDMVVEKKKVDRGVLIDALKEAVENAYKKNYNDAQNVEVEMDFENGDFRIIAIKKVVENVKTNNEEISLEDARKENPNCEIGDTVQVELQQKDFGRIAAQAAKQLVIQRIREAEKETIFKKFESKVDEIITGIIHRVDRNNVIIDLGEAEGILPYKEQCPVDRYKPNERMKFYVMQVKKTTKNPKIILSRKSPDLVKRLFELEVPEISEGTVEVKSISREAGSRTKIAVLSLDDNVDPVGACVGQKGSRVQRVVDELRGEKIDIIKWSSNPVEYISSSLSPATVVAASVNEEEKQAKVVVPDYQLSLAIGKEGQNVRLAARLTKWKIDIKSESQKREELEDELLFSETGDAEDETGSNSMSLFQDEETEEDNKED